MIQEAYVQGNSTRSVDDLVKAMGMSGISKSRVSPLREEFDGKVKAFLNRPLEGDWPYLWTEFLRKLTRRGLRGVKLVISDAHEGIKAAVSKVLSATWRRCRVHFQRNALAHAGKSGRRAVSAFIATAFAQGTAEVASTQWRAVADQIRPKVPKLATLMDDAEHDVLAYMSFPKEHWAKLHSTDEIDKIFARRLVILSACGRPRGESAGSATGQPM